MSLSNVGWNSSEDEDLERFLYQDRPRKRPQRVLELDEDAEPTKMRHRRSAAIQRKAFKFLDDRNDFLDEDANLKTEIEAFKSGRLTVDRLDVGRGSRFDVVWTGEDGEINIDKGVKLYDTREIVETFRVIGSDEGPRSPWFGLVDPRRVRTRSGRVGFDANLFWSVAFAFKHFASCGVSAWDSELLVMERDNADVNVNGRESDQKRYSGCVCEWRGSYGFLSCTFFKRRVFIHRNDIRGGGSESAFYELPVGASVNFAVESDGDRNLRAVDAKLFL